MKNIKAILRKNAKIIRNNIERDIVSAQINSKILNWNIYKKSQNIMLFYPVNTEISLLGLLKENNKNFYFPAVNGDSMYPVLYNPEKGFKTGKYNIMEPVGNKLSNYNVLDLIFVPALAVDTAGFRLGYGKGYYDRFLEEISAQCTTVVPISSELIFKELPKDKHDKSVDYIISENGIITTSARLLGD